MVRWLAALPLLVACSPDDPAFDVLADDLAATGAVGLAHLAGAERVRLTADGPEVALDDATWAVADVVVADERLGVRATADALELLVWVDREDAKSWVVLDAEGGSAPGGPVHLPAGSPVEVLERGERAARVLYESDTLTLDVWIDADTLDQVRDVPPVEAAPDIPPPGADMVEVLLPVDLHEGPDGEWLGELHRSEGNHGAVLVGNDAEATRVRSAGEPVGDWVPVEVTDGRAELVAWVAAERILHPDPMDVYGLRGWASAICGVHGWRSWSGPRPYARAGALVWDGPGGTAIGTVQGRQELVRSLEEDAEGWTSAVVATNLGEIVVWFEPDEVVEPVSQRFFAP